MDVYTEEEVASEAEEPLEAIVRTSSGVASKRLTSTINSSSGEKSKIVAGLLGILLGFGSHKLYLGITTPGIIMLILTAGGFAAMGFTCCLSGFLAAAVQIVGLVEGIIYLTKSDAEFYRIYVQGKKPWF